MNGRETVYLNSASLGLLQQTSRLSHMTTNSYVYVKSVQDVTQWMYLKHNAFFIYALLNDTVSKSDYIASNGKMINERRIGRDVQGSDRSLF
jgi:hypothetical protein